MARKYFNILKSPISVSLTVLILAQTVLADSAPPCLSDFYQPGCPFTLNMALTMVLKILIVGLIYLLINWTINSIIILFIIRRDRFKTLFNRESAFRILGLSALGLVADGIGFFIAELIISTGWNPHWSGFNIDSILYGIILFLVVGTLVTLNFYWIYSKKISEVKRVRMRDSITFGIISNPIWLYLLYLIFNKGY